MRKNIKIKPGIGLFAFEISSFPNHSYFVTSDCDCIFKKKTGVLRKGYIITSVIKEGMKCEIHKKASKIFFNPYIVVYDWWK